MILDVRNIDNYVYAYVCFNVVNKEDQMRDDGKYLLINGFWIHKEHRQHFQLIFDYFVNTVFYHPSTKNVEFVYWERDGRKTKFYLASKFIRRLYGSRSTNINPVATVHTY